MPNWCNNRLILKHKDKAMLNKAEEAFRKGELLNAFIPVPKELLDSSKILYSSNENEKVNNEKLLEENTKKYGYPSWYEFRNSEWGTKWDVGGKEGIVNDFEGGLEFLFDSAWAPPTAAYDKLIGLGFEVYATYHESGMAFIGEYDNGIDNSYDTDDRNIPEHLENEYMSDYSDEDTEPMIPLTEEK